MDAERQSKIAFRLPLDKRARTAHKGSRNYFAGN